MRRGPGRQGAGPARAEAQDTKWHTLAVAEVVRRLATDASAGLDATEAARRLAEGGPNRIAEQSRRSPARMLWDQLQDFMVLVLLGAAGVSALLGEVADAVAILAIVVVNACLGYLQEARAERSLDALRRLAAPTARVVRSRVACNVPAEGVVPGDLLTLAAGDRVPADARLIEAQALEVEESALTGESAPVAKSVAPLTEAGARPGDRVNAVFQGTHVTRGSGRALVTATGMRTEVGRIAGLIGAATDASTPLQRRLDRLGRALVLACLLLSALVVLSGVLRGEDPYRMFLRGAAACRDGEARQGRLPDDRRRRRPCGCPGRFPLARLRAAAP